MNNLDKLLSEVNKTILNEEIVKEYFRLKSIIENDEEITNLDKEVRLHQKTMCAHKDEDDIYFKEKDLYESSLAKLEANPIYINFVQIKKEVNELLLEIKDYLS